MADTAKISRAPRSPVAPGPPEIDADEAGPSMREAQGGILRAGQSASFAVENMNCGGCMSKIERELNAVSGIGYVRANLSRKRVEVAFDRSAIKPSNIEAALKGLGFKAHQIDSDADGSKSDDVDLLYRLGVAGFAAANVMLLSVAVWAGMASDMDNSSMNLFHYLSALIALPAIAYSGQPFFSSAKQALSVGRMNMDVPISLAVILATAMSLFQTMQGREQVYFDASITLLFFLLIGRYLDHAMRSKAKSAAENLIELKSDHATIIQADGTMEIISTDALAPGMILLIARGENIPCDGVVVEGESAINEALLTGESLPRMVSRNDKIFAGTINHAAPIRIKVTAVSSDTTLAEISRLMAVAEQARGRYVRLADRAAAIYAPGIHLIGALTFFGWLALGAGWEQSLMIAISVLIITCPCALALAVPAVQVAAASRLFSMGMILKSGDGLERLAEIDHLVFDKTGTLTYGKAILQNMDDIEEGVLRRAAGLASASTHPYSRAIVKAARQRFGTIKPATDVEEHIGLGLSQTGDDGEQRLGSKTWCNEGRDGDRGKAEENGFLWFREPDAEPVMFKFSDPLRPDAVDIIAKLKASGFGVELLSGDARNIVRATAETTGIENWSAEMNPADKIERLAQLEREGRKVLMVGDGLNDAPALSAGHASLAPSSAADISKTAADVILQGEYLSPLFELIQIARKSRRLSLQNFALALAYNALFIPLAVAGLVTPLIAAIAMSTSSIVVTANALRLQIIKRQDST